MLKIQEIIERISFEVTQEIVSQHFGDSRDMSVEGSSVKKFTSEDIKLYQKGLLWLLYKAHSTVDFHSHFWGNNLQNASSVHCHIYILLSDLKIIHRFVDGLTMFDNTDWCSKQYLCTTEIELLLMIATELSVWINRAVAGPGHRKDLIDGLNSCNKHYLKQTMIRVKLPGNEETLG